MTTSRSNTDWDVFIGALAATTAQIPDETTSVVWGSPGGPEFVTTRTSDGRYAIVLDATNFPEAVDPYLPPELGWFIPTDEPALDSTFALVKDSSHELALAAHAMLTDWALIRSPDLFLSPGGVESSNSFDVAFETLDEDSHESADAMHEAMQFTGLELQSGLRLRTEFESLFSQLDVPSFTGPVPGAYAVFISDVAVDLYIDEVAPSIQLQAEVRRDLPDSSDGLFLANELNTIATFARFHYEHERLLATWHLSESYYTPRALLQEIFGFASAVYSAAAAIPATAPGTPVEWDSSSFVTDSERPE